MARQLYEYHTAPTQTTRGGLLGAFARGDRLGEDYTPDLMALETVRSGARARVSNAQAAAARHRSTDV